MIEDILLIGSKIEMQRYKNSIQTNERVLVSQLLDIKEEGKICIAMPMDGGRIVLLDVGERYEMFFYTANGLYRCLAAVDCRYRSKQLVMAEMVFLSAIEKYQRRQYFRLNCILDVVYWKKETPSQVKHGMAIDISGGGMRFNGQEQLEPEDILCLRFSIPNLILPPGKEILGRVIASSRLVNKERMYENRIEFQDIEGDVRETIVKYVFDEERKRRRRDNGG